MQKLSKEEYLEKRSRRLYVEGFCDGYQHAPNHSSVKGFLPEELRLLAELHYEQRSGPGSPVKSGNKL